MKQTINGADFRRLAISAAASVEESIASKQSVQSLLVSTIAGYYYNLIMLDEKLNTSRRTVENWEENIRTMEALKRAGKTTEAAVLQAKANKLKIESSIFTMEHTIQTVENEFAALLGIALGVLLAVSTKKGKM